jgi:hypothetical protein
MSEVFYLETYRLKEQTINEILASNLVDDILDCPIDYSDEARDILRIYFIDHASFKERVETYLKFQLDIKKDYIANALNDILQVLEAC